MNDTKKWYLDPMITYSTMILMIALDQISKQLTIHYMPIQVFVDTQKYTAANAFQVIPFLWINHVVNFGAAWSIFYGQKYLLLFFNFIIYSGIIYYEFTSRGKKPKILAFAIGFILGGAGNFIDRARMGYVTDFFEFRNLAGQNVFPIFNVADISVDIGIALLLIYFFFIEGKLKAKENNEDEKIEEIV